MLDKFHDFLKRHMTIDAYAEAIRRQPLIRKYWLAEDVALEKIFTSLSDPELTSRIEELTHKLFEGYRRKRLIESDSENEYKELAVRNARRTVYSARFDLQDEVGPMRARYIEEELTHMGVAEEFLRLYGGKTFMDTPPDKPYFHEKE